MEQAVYFYNDDGEKLAGTLHLPQSPSRCGVILGHCFTCSRHTSIIRDIARHLALENITALRFDFSGNGQSEGKFIHTTYTKHIGEMKQAAAFLKNKSISCLGLAGHSMGASIAVLTASQLDNVLGVCALAGRLGGTSAVQLFSQEQMVQLEKTGQLSFKSRGRDLTLSQDFFSDIRNYDLPQILLNFKPSLLVVHGDQDEITPVENAYHAKSLKPDSEICIIEGADHMFMNSDHRSQIVQHVVKWFKKIFAKK